MGSRPRSPIALREVVDLPIAPAAAYQLVADFGRLAEWDPAVERADLIGGERLTPGARYRVTVRFLGRRPVLEYELSETTGPALTVYRATGARIDAIDRIEITPAPGGCRISFSTEMTPTGWLAASRWLIVPLMRRQAARSLAALRAHATTLLTERR